MSATTSSKPRNVEERLQLVRMALVLYRQRKVIAAASVGCALLAFVVSLLLPKVYESTAAVVVLDDKSQSFGSVVALSQVTESLAGAGFPTFTLTRDLFMNVLRSRSLAEAVVQGCNLQEVYELKSMARTVKRLRSFANIYSSKDGLISITVRAYEPELAAKIANVHVVELDRIVTEKRVSDAGRQRRFISKRLEQTAEELATVEESYRDFQEEHNLVSLENQVTGVSTAAHEMTMEIRSLQATLSARTTVLSEDNPLSREFRLLIDEKKRQLAEIQGGKQLLALGDGAQLKEAAAVVKGETGSTPVSSVYHASSDLPSLQLQLRRLSRDVILKNKIYSILIEEFERAAILESRDEPIVHRIDAAVPAERPAGPRVTLIAAVALIAGFFLAVSGVLITDYFRESRELWRRQCARDVDPTSEGGDG